MSATRVSRRPARSKICAVEDVAREQELVAGKLVLDRIAGYDDLFRERGYRRPRNPAVATPDAHA